MRGKNFGRVAKCGMMVALAFLLSYIEFLIPIPTGIPGVKLGLANLVIFAALYLTDVRNAFIIMVVRVILTALTFGNMFYGLFSIAGGVLSLLLMLLCKKKNLFSKVGVSIVGGVSHNVAQILVAMLVLETPELVWYLPVLLLSGTVAGAVIGIVGGLLLERITGIYTRGGNGEI